MDTLKVKDPGKKEARLESLKKARAARWPNAGGRSGGAKKRKPTNPKGPKKPIKIFWDVNEVELVAIEAARLMAVSERELPTALRKAEELLPDGRRRHLKTVAGLMRPGAMFKQYFDAERNRIKKALDRPEADPAGCDLLAELTAENKRLKKELATAINARAEPTPSTGQRLSDFDTSDIALEFATRVNSGDIDRLEKIERRQGTLCGELESVRDEIRKAAASIESIKGLAPKKTELPRIAVVGLKRDQFTELDGRTDKTKSELVFLNKDQAAPSLPGTCLYAVVQRHCGHSWYNAARNAVGNDRVAFVRGGIMGTLAAVNMFAEDYLAEAVG